MRLKVQASPPSSSPNFTAPALYRLKMVPSTIVLFLGHSAKNHLFAGVALFGTPTHYSENWVKDKFEPYEGTLTLSNLHNGDENG